MKQIFIIIVLVIFYLLFSYFFAMQTASFFKSMLLKTSVFTSAQFTDLIGALSVGGIFIWSIYYYGKTYMRIYYKLNLQRLFTYMVTVLVIDFLVYSLLVYNTFNVNLVFRWDITAFYESIFYFMRIVIINAVIFELLLRGALVEYLLINKIKPVWIVLFSASIFALILLLFGAYFIPCFCFGLLSALVYVKERNVIYCILLNMVWVFAGAYVMNWNI